MTGFRRPAGARHPVRVLMGALLAHLVCCGAVRAQEEEILYEDVIERRNMPPVTDVRIEEDSWKLVVGAKGEIKFRVPSSKVLEVQYADASREFNQGLRRVKQRYFTPAIEQSFGPTLKKLDKFRKVGGHPWAKQYCLYYLGLCHLRRGEAKKGDAAKARGYFERLVKEIPDSRFIFEAYMGVGDSYQVDGRYKEAAKAFTDAQKRFDKMSGATGIPFEQVRAVRKRALMARLRQAEMLEMAKDYDRAVTMFERVAGRARDHPDIRFMALSGAVRCRVSMGSYDQAILKANQLIEQGEHEGHTQFLGGAYMALADCYFEKFRVAEQKDKKGGGRKQADPQDLVAARYEYLRVATLYFEDRRVLPKAHFRAGRCYERLSTLSRSEGETAKELGKRQYRLVAGQFPDNPWAAQAKSRLAALGVKFKTVEEEEREEEEEEKKRTPKKRGVLPMDFEGNDYGDWALSGKAFGTGPSRGGLKGQSGVTGFQGHGLANSYVGGDKSKGMLTSPAFKIERKFIRFLIGGGKHARQTCINLLVGGKSVRTATGKNNAKLEWRVWDVGGFKGKSARIQIADKHAGGWGHITVDQIMASDTRTGGASPGGGRKRKR